MTIDYDPIRASDRTIQRLRALHPSKIDFSTGRVERLLAALGHPERETDEIERGDHAGDARGPRETPPKLRG